MVHEHGGGHGHSHGFGAHALEARREDSRRRLGVVLAINVVLLAVEAIGGVLTGSLAVLADAGHLLSDVGSIVLAVGIGLYPLPGLLAYTAPLTLFAFVLLSWLLMRAHDRRLCEQCVMAMPLNPAEKATKLKRRFWMAHTGSEPRFLIPYLVVLISSNFATSG